MSTISTLSSQFTISNISVKKKPAPINPSNTASAGGLLQLPTAMATVAGKKLSLYPVADDVISQNIIGIHDSSQAVRQDVESLYSVVTNIVKSSTHIGPSLDLKRAKSIELVEDKVPQTSSFMPSLRYLERDCLPEKWNKEEKEKFEHLKSLTPWYVVQYFSLIKGINPLQEEWNYPGKPIVVVANARGEVINKNALHMIFVWGYKAFPFHRGDDEKLSLHCNWFWTETIKINPEFEKWVTRENKYVFIYGGIDKTWTQKFDNLLDTIKRDPIMKQTNTFIEQFNLAKVDPTKKSKFWVNITNSFLSKIRENNFELDFVLKDIQTLLSMKNRNGWAVVNKLGENVLKLGYDDSIMSMLKGFGNWRNRVLKLQGFDIAFKEYYGC